MKLNLDEILPIIWPIIQIGATELRKAIENWQSVEGREPTAEEVRAIAEGLLPPKEY